jgi:hypothetical protein
MKCAPSLRQGFLFTEPKPRRADVGKRFRARAVNMATNLLQPNGLQLLRNLISGAPTYQGNQYTIKAGYGSNIGKGDPVKTGTGTNQGYIVLASPTDTEILGIFQGVLPYYDQTLQATSHGLNGAYQSSANPISDIPCMVYSDAFTTFAAQVNGGPFVQSWRGQNISFIAAAGGVGPGLPNLAGISTTALDGGSVGTGPALPFRIVGTIGVVGGPQDPTNTNPWLEVRLNTAEMLAPTGI